MNKPNKTELEYFIRYSLDSDKYKRYIELYEEIERLNEERKEFIKFGIEDERTIDRLKYKLNKIEEYARNVDLVNSNTLLDIIGDEDLETNEEYFKDCLNDLKSIYESLCYSAPEMTPVFLGQMKEIFDDIEEVVGVNKE